MKITTQSQAITIGNRVRNQLRKRVLSALERFDHAIERVDVYLKDINGPKGGADKQVIMVIWMEDGQRLAGEATEANLHAAVASSADKAKRQVRRAIDKARQVDRHSVRGQRGTSTDVATMEYS